MIVNDDDVHDEDEDDDDDDLHQDDHDEHDGDNDKDNKDDALCVQKVWKGDRKNANSNVRCDLCSYDLGFNSNKYPRAVFLNWLIVVVAIGVFLPCSRPYRHSSHTGIGVVDV